MRFAVVAFPTVPERDGPIWYDGATRARHDAVERIERDALGFLAQAVRDFERDDSAWRLLLDDLDIPVGLDDPADYGYATISHAFSINVTADLVVLGLCDLLPRQLAATFSALTKQPWCVAPRLHEGSIEMQVRRLGPAKAVRIEKELSLRARAVHDRMQRGIAKLISLVAPSPLPRVTDALDDARRTVEAISAAKIERLRCSGEPFVA